MQRNQPKTRLLKSCLLASLIVLSAGCQYVKLVDFKKEIARLDSRIRESSAVPVVVYSRTFDSRPDCQADRRPAGYVVLVDYEGGCPVGVSFDAPGSGCFPEPAANDPLPPVCLCTSGNRNEQLRWRLGRGAPVNEEFTVHFSPFGNGSFSSTNGETERKTITKAGAGAGRDLIVYKYSITTNRENSACRPLDPPIIIEQ